MSEGTQTRTPGKFGNIYFDPDIFSGYMQEQSCLNPAIIQSGILVEDPIIRNALTNSGNVGTTPFFLPIDDETDALNYDGKTDNVPTELKNSKQTYMAIGRQKAWKETTFVRYLSGKSPLQNLADNLVVPYWTNQWQQDLLAIIKGILGVSAMASHITDLSVDSSKTGATITDSNKIALESPIDAGQKALGDKRKNFSLFICHSVVATRLLKLDIAQNRKYTIPGVAGEVELKTIGDMVILETDDGTLDDSTTGFPEYHSYMVGKGTFLTSSKTVDRPYYQDYNPEKNGGVDMLYTKQSRVIHPNGFSIVADNIASDSPTRTELGTAANWTLKFNHRNIAIAEIISNG